MMGLILAIRQITENASRIPDCIRFDIGEPGFDTPQHIKEAAINAINDGFTGYTSSFGISELRKAVAEKERQKGLNIDMSNVLITTGGMGALNCCLLNIICPGDEVIASNPSWSPYDLITTNAYGNLTKTKYFEDGEFAPSNIKKCINKKTKAIIVNSPENPTGRVFKKGELQEIVEMAREHDLFIISDEVYEKIIFRDTPHHSIAPMAPERTFLINSCSKTYAMTGWRIGWLICPDQSTELMMRTNRALVACPNSISQKAALIALTGPQNCVETMIVEHERRSEYATENLEEMGLNFLVPSGTFYIFPDIERDPWKFSKDLLEKKKVSVIPGDAFGSEGRTCIRLALTIDMERIKTGLKRIGEQLGL